MKIALIQASRHEVSHRVRGMGIYAESLAHSLKKYFPENEYILNTKEGTDLVHYIYFEPFFRTLPLFEKKKRIVTVHDLTPLIFPKNFPAGIKGALKWQMQKIALKNTDLVITDSLSSKRDIHKFTGINENKIKVIYLAASENFRKLEAGKADVLLKKYNLPEKFALYVGDATWNKNLVRLLEAVTISKVPLVMAGKALLDKNFDVTNPWNKELLEVQKLASDDKNIVRLGFVPQEELVALYNKATLFVMPSIYEGFGLPLLEAMACGAPCVTSNKGSIPEVGGEAVLIVDPTSVNDVAEAIKKVFEDKDLREKLTRKGFEQVKKFNWEKTARQTLEAYKEVLSRG